MLLQASEEVMPSLELCEGLTVMSFNVWWDSGESLDRVCDIVRLAGTDLVGLQECSLESAKQLAEALGLYYAGAVDRREPVLSRWPVEAVGPELACGRGFRVHLPEGEVLWYNLHLPSCPYAPYTLHDASRSCAVDPFEDPFRDFCGSGCEDDENLLPTPSTPTSVGSTADLDTWAVALDVERKTQVPGLIEILDALRMQMASAPPGDMPVQLVTGDFNAASHLDYPDGPAWPSSRLCAARGLLDSFHEARRLGVAALEPCHTWAAKESQEPRGIHDRIDFIYACDALEVRHSRHLDAGNSGVPNWPSDHRAVLSTFRWVR